MKNKKSKLKILFIALFLALSLAPLVLMPWLGNQEAESADANVFLKPLMIDGKLNSSFFTDETGKFDSGFMETVGDYFQKKFALRREMVTAGDFIKAKVFGVSGQDGVVVGRKGYLFYKDSFNDFLGRDELSQADIAALAHNVKLMQDELEAGGIKFLFTVAPNKNSLYPELMPGKYRPDIKKRNITRLVPLLKENGVNYLDLYGLFNNIDEVMYLKGDSHWNNTGAALVTGELIDALGKKRVNTDDGHFEKRKAFNGDLNAMLYPAGNVKDWQIYYDKMDPVMYNERVEIKMVDDETGEMTAIDPVRIPNWSESSEIETRSFGSAEGSLLMIRDSFGNSLSLWVAEEFGKALFLNGTPYAVGRAPDEGYETVIFEIVERNLNRLIDDAPVISTSGMGIPEDEKAILEDLSSGANSYIGSIKMEPSDTEFEYTYVTAELDPEKTKGDVKPYLMMKNTETGETEYHALFRTSGYGAACYIKTEDIASGNYSLSLAYEQGGRWNASGKLGEYTKEDI